MTQQPTTATTDVKSASPFPRLMRISEMAGHLGMFTKTPSQRLKELEHGGHLAAWGTGRGQFYDADRVAHVLRELIGPQT